VLEDGVAPDVDMIIVEADSPALDRTRADRSKVVLRRPR
jgi:hypothetical protein